VVRRIGAHVLTLGFSMMAVGFSVTGWAATHAALGVLFYAGLVLAGVGQGLVLPSIMRIVLGEVAPAKAGLASGVVTSTLQIGSAFGTAAISGAFFGALSAHASARGYAYAFQRSLAINAVLMVVCIALSVTLVKHQQRAYRRTIKPA
jgi:MFS family permease